MSEEEDPLTMSFDTLLTKDHGLSEEVICHLRLLTLMMEHSIQARIEAGKRLTSMDEELYKMSETVSEVKKWAGITLKPNPMNPVEGTDKYQLEQGIDKLLKKPNIKKTQIPLNKNIKPVDDYILAFRDPKDKAVFQEALGLLRKLNPNTQPYNLFRFLFG